MTVGVCLRTQMGISIDPDVALWADAVVANGGTPYPGVTIHLSAYVGALKAAGIWAKLDRNPIWGAATGGTGIVDLRSRVAMTPVNNPVITGKVGIAFNGTTQYVNSLFNPSTAGGAYSLNAAHLGVWCLNNVASGSQFDVGAQDTGTQRRSILLCRDSGGTAIGYAVNGSTTGAESQGTISTSVGLTVAVRRASNDSKCFRDGVLLGGAATVSAAGMVNRNILFGAVSNGASPGFYSTRAQFAASIGGDLTDSEVAGYYAALSTLKAAMAALP